MENLVKILVCALVGLYSLSTCEALTCYKCSQLSVVEGQNIGPCFEGIADQLTVQHCKMDEVCMKYIFDAGLGQVVHRDCAAPSEDCDQFRERKVIETGLQMDIKGRTHCYKCESNECNSSDASIPSLVSLIISLILSKLLR